MSNDIPEDMKRPMPYEEALKSNVEDETGVPETDAEAHRGEESGTETLSDDYAQETPGLRPAEPEPTADEYPGG